MIKYNRLYIFFPAIVTIPIEGNNICITNTVCFAYLAGENKKQALDILNSTGYI